MEFREVDYEAEDEIDSQIWVIGISVAELRTTSDLSTDYTCIMTSIEDLNSELLLNKNCLMEYQSLEVFLQPRRPSLIFLNSS
jgi:hypothetical protein